MLGENDIIPICSFYSTRNSSRIYMFKLKKMPAFLHRKLTQEQIEELTDHVRVGSQGERPTIYMKASVTSNDCLFIRQGETNDWKNYFSPEANFKIDEWIKNYLAGSDLNFSTILQD